MTPEATLSTADGVDPQHTAVFISLVVPRMSSPNETNLIAIIIVVY